jgi:hypothetical protein
VFPQRPTPDPLFYRGLGYGIVGAGLIWCALTLVVWLLR